MDLILSKRSDDRSVLRLSEFSSSAHQVSQNTDDITAVSFNQDEIVLDDEDEEDVCNETGQASEENNETKTLAIESITRRSFLNLPSPKRPLQVTNNIQKDGVCTNVTVFFFTQNRY